MTHNQFIKFFSVKRICNHIWSARLGRIKGGKCVQRAQHPLSTQRVPALWRVHTGEGTFPLSPQPQFAPAFGAKLKTGRERWLQPVTSTPMHEAAASQGCGPPKLLFTRPLTAVLEETEVLYCGSVLARESGDPGSSPSLATSPCCEHPASAPVCARGTTEALRSLAETASQARACYNVPYGNSAFNCRSLLFLLAFVLRRAPPRSH